MGHSKIFSIPKQTRRRHYVGNTRPTLDDNPGES